MVILIIVINNNAYSHLKLFHFVSKYSTNISTCISAHIIAANPIKDNQFNTVAFYYTQARL